MRRLVRRRVLAAVVVALAATLPAGWGADSRPPAANASPDVSQELAEARQLMDRKDWTAALVELKRALRKDHRNADVYALMGYSYRKSGQLDDAFDSYRTALRIAPDHRSAHEYIGEAYLQANQPEKARQHLAALKRVCGAAGCEEYRDLAKAVAGWQRSAAAAKR